MELLKKYWLQILTVIFALLWINSCSSNSSNASLVRTQTAEIDSLKLELVETAKFKEDDFERMFLLMQHEGYSISGRMLYDNNKIVRTKERPDDKMREYTLKQEEIQKELESKKND